MHRAVLGLPLLAALFAPAAHAAAGPPRLLELRVDNGSTPFLGDGRLLTTVSPNGDGFRDAAHLEFRLSTPAQISLAIIRTDTARSDPEAAAATVIQRLGVRAYPKGAGTLAAARVDWPPHRDAPAPFASCVQATGRAASTSFASPPRTGVSAMHPSSSVRARSAGTASPSCSRHRAWRTGRRSAATGSRSTRWDPRRRPEPLSWRASRTSSAQPARPR
jgi:hypothetical protein